MSVDVASSVCSSGTLIRAERLLSLECLDDVRLECEEREDLDPRDDDRRENEEERLRPLR